MNVPDFGAYEAAARQAAGLLEHARQELSKLLTPDLINYITDLVSTIERAKEKEAKEAPLIRVIFARLATRGWVGLENHLAADIEMFHDEIVANDDEWLDATVCSEFRDKNWAGLDTML